MRPRRGFPLTKRGWFAKITWDEVLFMEADDSLTTTEHEPRPRQSTARQGSWISLTLAASALDRPRQDVERWVREWKVVLPEGDTGKGGRYVINLDDLVVLQSTGRLDDLHVPAKAIIKAMRQVRTKLRDKLISRLAIAYTGGDSAHVSQNLDVPQAALAHGVSVQVIDADAERAALSKRLKDLPPPAKRGRPAVNSAWVQERLSASDVLGSDDLTPDEAQQLSPHRGTLPWRKTTRSSRS